MAQFESDLPRQALMARGYGRQAAETPAGPSAAALRIGDVLVEARPLGACHAIVAPWRALAAAAIEPNIFHEPDFLLAAHQHLVEAAQLHALLVWDPRGDGAAPGDPAGAPRLIGLWPFRRARRGPARGFASAFLGSGAPLLDAGLAVEAASAMLSFPELLGLRPSGATFGPIRLDGPAAQALRSAARLCGLPSAELAARERPCLEGAPRARGASRSARAPAAEERRSARGLAQLGDVRLLSASTGGAMREGVELLLALEASGSGHGGVTPILRDPRHAAFFRTMTRALAQQGQAELHLIEAGGRIAAGALVLTSGGASWSLAASQDGGLAAQAPAALLALELRDTVLPGHGATAHACGEAVLPILERVWRSRERVGDLALGFRGGAARLTTRERARRAAQAWIGRARRSLGMLSGGGARGSG